MCHYERPANGRRRSRTFALGSLVFSIVLAHVAMANSYEALYAFGDSYSDTGARLIDSNGSTAVAYLAEHMGIILTCPQDAGGGVRSINFAASGAVSGKEPSYSLKGHVWCCQGMMDQVEDFARRVRSGWIAFNSQTTLFFIAGGLNDSRLPTEVTIRNLTRQILLLKEVGAYHITLALLPTKIPSFSAVGQRLNPAYSEMVFKLRKQLKIDLQLNHWGSYFDEVLENPLRYGITNTTSRCAGRAIFDEDTTPCAAPETYYYYYEGHPSTAVSRIVGEKLYRELAEISSSSMKRAAYKQVREHQQTSQ